MSGFKDQCLGDFGRQIREGCWKTFFEDETSVLKQTNIIEQLITTLLGQTRFTGPLNGGSRENKYWSSLNSI